MREFVCPMCSGVNSLERISLSEIETLRSENKKMREALEYTATNIGCVQSGTSTQEWIKRVNTALVRSEETK